MKINGFEVRRIKMPLVAPFRTSFGTETQREILIIRVVTPDADGWGECVASVAPLYSSEFVDSSIRVIESFLAPRLLAPDSVEPADVAELLAPVKGHKMAKAALEMGVMDAWLRTHGIGLSSFLGATRERVPAGVSVGIMDSIPQLLDVVGQYLDEGYLRIKLKIEPGWDVEPVRAVREQYGDDLLLQADANAAYTLGDSAALAALDPFNLLLLEQPLAEDDFRHHADLAKKVSTPICLDESIESARDAADAIAWGAASIINIKPGRVGGYLEARRIHDVCVANGVPVWCGGMLETGLGRAANVALAAMPGFALPGDTSASSRYYAEDITEPFVLDAGHLAVPEGIGIGIDPLPDVLEKLTIDNGWICPA